MGIEINNEYWVLLTGHGEGCDYTIGCNLNWRKLKTTNLEEVIEEVKEIIDEYADPSIVGAKVLRVCDIMDIDIKEIKENKNKLIEEQKQKELKEKERAELERLKNKYPDK